MPKTGPGKAHEQLIAENAELRARLDEAEETLRAIRSGEVDALIVAGPGGDQVFTLSGADRVYRELIENMSEGALTLTADGVILYANRRFADMVQTPLERVIGGAIAAWLAPDSRAVLPAMLRSGDERRSAEVVLAAGSGAQLAANLSVNRLFMEDLPDIYCVVVTDLTEQKQRTVALVASEEKFQYVFDNSVSGKSLTLPSGEINANQAFCDMLGYTRAELAGRTWQELTHPDDIALTERMLAPLRAGKQDSTRFTKRYRHKDGSTIWAEVGTALRRSADGKPQYYITSVNDITRRRQAEENLRHSEALLRLVADNLPAYVAYVSASTLCYQFVNRRYAESFRRPVEEIIGQPVANILSRANFEFAWPYIMRALRGEPCSYENMFPLAEGERWLQVNFVPSCDQSGQVTGIVILNHDLTERKQAEEALREAEERFHSLFERHDAIMLLIRPHGGEIVDANMAAARFYGYPLDELLRMNIAAINMLPPEQVAAERERILAEQCNYFIFPHRLASGEVRTVEVHSTPIAVGGQQLLFSIIHDITGRMQAEVALRQSEEKWRSLFELLPIGVSIVDANYQVLDVNPALSQILDLSQADLVQGIHKDRRYLRRDNTLMPREEFPSIRAAEGKTTVQNVEVGVEKEDGVVVWTSVSAAPLPSGAGSAIVTVDITESKQAEEERDRLQVQLAEAQKMELVGRLAGGIAHEFNNMLAGIMLRTELLRHGAEPDTPLQRGLTTIYSVSQRAAEMVQSLLGFARKQMIAPKLLDLNAAVQSSLPMLHNLVGEEIAVDSLPGAHLWSVKIDPTQFEQILINLCANARDAITGVGTITIETSMLELAHAVDVSGREIPPSAYVMLAVTDTGCGMDAALLAHIFEPFFTTKEVGKGSGLGLAAVAGIVQQNRGHIQVFSEVGAGTTFKIYLPCFAEPVRPAEQGQTPSLPHGHGETVLLVEDEAVVLQMAVDALLFLGYAVIAAATPATAIHMMESHAGTVDLLMTDVVMPGMNGGELAERIAVIQPDIKRLFISGYPADIVAQRGVLGDDVNFLQKPFTLQELATKVRDVLDVLENPPPPNAKLLAAARALPTLP